MREPTRMKEVEGAGTVITTNLGAEFYKVAGSTGKSNPGAKGHIREIIYDGMGKFAEAPRVCADQCKASGVRIHYLKIKSKIILFASFSVGSA